MRLLINCSNIRKSGALQVTVSLLEEIRNIPGHDYHVVASDEVLSQIDRMSYPLNFTFYLVSLGRPFSKSFRVNRQKLAELERNIRPDCVFSVFAPVYWRPKAPHLTGFAYGWAINPDSKYIRGLSFPDKFKMWIENSFKGYYFRHDSQWFVVETEQVRYRMARYLGIDAQRIYVVGNTYSHFFVRPLIPNKKITPRNDDEFRLVTISSNFPHKNLGVINEASRELDKMGEERVRFYVTLPDADFKALFDGNARVVNMGVVKPSECPYIYAQCDATLLPSQLECFTAVYPESMISRRPILTSDLDFANAICNGAALLFDPFDGADIARKIVMLMEDRTLYEALVERGLRRVKDFPTARSRAEQYVKICEKIVADGKGR